MDARPRRRTLARTGVTAAIAGGVAVLAALFYGPRIIVCWMGIGPAPEPQTSQCVTRILVAMAPWDRFQYDHPILAAVLVGFVTFVATFAVLLALGAALRRARAR